MKKIKIMLSIAVLFVTVAIVGISSSQVAFAEEESAQCNCEWENPHDWGIIRDGNCSVESCWHTAD